MYLEGAKIYQTEKGVYNVLKKYVDEIANYKFYKSNLIELTNKNIDNKILSVVINDILITESQFKAFKRIIEYAKLKGVEIKIIKLK